MILRQSRDLCVRELLLRLFGSRRFAPLFLLANHNCSIAIPNVRAKRDPTVGRQAREVQDKPPRLAGLVARRWGSA